MDGGLAVCKGFHDFVLVTDCWVYDGFVLELDRVTQTGTVGSLDMTVVCEIMNG